MLPTKIAAALAILTVSCIAEAKDVAGQQASVEYARDTVEKTQSVHKENLERVANSGKRVEQARKQLEEARKQLEDDKKKAKLSGQQLDEANAKLMRAQNLLDEAWKK